MATVEAKCPYVDRLQCINMEKANTTNNDTVAMGKIALLKHFNLNTATKGQSLEQTKSHIYGCKCKWYTRYGKGPWRIYGQSHEHFKKTGDLINPVNLRYINEHPSIEQVQCDIVPYYEVAEAELDEMWSYVFSKENPRWLWVALDHQNRQILAYAFGRRKDEVFRSFQKILTPYQISIFYTDDWGSYERNIPAYSHVIGKKNTQIIERKNLTLRTRIKRLCRKTICFSKSVTMHDIVIGLVINILDFGWVYPGFNNCST